MSEIHRACRKCGSTSFRTTEVTFKNGTTHLERRCNPCGSFIDYAAQEIPAGMFVMPYGKHKGRPLRWIAENDRAYGRFIITWCNPSIQNRMREVIRELDEEIESKKGDKPAHDAKL